MTPSTSTAPTLALIAPGGMGAALAARLSYFGAGSILTNLEGRSQATRERAAATNMVHATYADIVARATCIYSVVPPSDAFATAQSVVDAYKSTASDRSLIFVDCNAVNPESAKQLAALFEGTRITFLDGAIIGTPPTDTFNPAIYVCADPKDAAVLDDFTAMSIKYGLNVVPLKGKDAKIGDASAVKMAHAVCIVKGTIGLFTTMILAANASSPSTAEGLLHALNFSQPTFVDQIIRLMPPMPQKAYRFVREMEEVGAFVGESAGSRTYEGISEIFARVAESQEHPVPGGDVELLMNFVEEAQKLRAEK
ncbi:6-phosphogluconate dehydrogenase C-terminal domain-like protein [Roridomyces roridus]|uniref:6-phosphogluconate dehydrogenase C-terminal domain-like protein n=1 Tax=Roridomyces roridus TaxID=1738132 RepID=A0AAD7BLY2_9AGAR|nr:6-phosphogluconate dehydrogenase C-terminal domain-like protein [Roridomyces roridus]